MSGNFPPHVSAKSTSNISPNTSKIKKTNEIKGKNREKNSKPKKTKNKLALSCAKLRSSCG